MKKRIYLSIIYFITLICIIIGVLGNVYLTFLLLHA